MRKISRGFTLIEMLVVVFVFSIVGVMVTRSIQLTLRASRKSKAITEVQNNIDYAMNVIERRLRIVMAHLVLIMLIKMRVWPILNVLVILAILSPRWVG